jgi:hypothetical protein
MDQMNNVPLPIVAIESSSSSCCSYHSWRWLSQTSTRGTAEDVIIHRFVWDSAIDLAIPGRPPVSGTELKIAVSGVAARMELALKPVRCELQRSAAGGGSATETLTVKMQRVELARMRPFCPEDCVPVSPDGVTIGDGQVTIADITHVITRFGSNGGRCDVAPDNGDGTWGDNNISIADITKIITAFGPCP